MPKINTLTTVNLFVLKGMSCAVNSIPHNLTNQSISRVKCGELSMKFCITNLSPKMISNRLLSLMGVFPMIKKRLLMNSTLIFAMLVVSFTQIFRMLNLLTIPLINFNPRSMALFPASNDEIIATIQSIKNNSNLGDLLPSFYIKKCHDILVDPITTVINNCLQDGHFPNESKTSKIVPIFKTGDSLLPVNY